jgi:hypothetical protein
MPHMEAEDEIRRLQFWAVVATVAPAVPAVRAAHPREPVDQDAAPQIAAEIALHPRWTPQPMGSASCASTRKVSRWCWTTG